MASVFQSYSLFIDKDNILLSADMLKDLEAYGNTIFVVDGDVAVMLTEHKGDIVFTTVGIELESDPGTYARLVREYFDLPESVSERLIIEPILE